MMLNLNAIDKEVEAITNKALSVIRSCNTPEQKVVAHRYAKLVVKRLKALQIQLRGGSNEKS